jgi:hypothetical protein
MLPLSTLNYQLALILLSDLRTRWVWDPLRNVAALSENPGRPGAEDDTY